MHIRWVAVCFLIVLLLSASAVSAENIRLTPQKGAHQFPFFDQPTSVWNYNGQVPGPTIRAKVGSRPRAPQVEGVAAQPRGMS